MADIQNLIKTINNKFTNNDYTVSKIYKDEPILKTAAQMANFTPPKYREMRKLVKSSPGFYASDTAQIFYEQGKFMEDYTDDYQYNGEFRSYYPTYQSMTDQQLRGYFSWRTRVRDGIIDKTSLSFVFVYIYELLMQIGVSSAEEGFYKIKNFWQIYKDIDPKINHYIKLWLKDYVIYNGLEKHLLDDFSDMNLDHTILTLINCYSHSADEIFSALNSLSSYNLENSRFYKLYSDDVKHVVYNVFAELTEYYNKKRKNSICEKFFGKIMTNQYVMFNSAVFYNHEIHKDCVYEINDVCKYICKNGKWTYERFFFFKDKNKHIGELLKTIDFIMRQEYDFKSTLKVDMVKKVYQDIIQKVIGELLEEKKKKSVPKIEIDISKLQNIRKTALETQNKLIVEDSEEITISDVPEAAAQVAAAVQEDAANLSNIEYEFMKCLLYGKDYSDLVKSNGLMLSVLIDSINEKLFDLFCDTVLIFDGDEPELIEDYEDELKAIIL
ncbi:TerB N-terminal domain-containing protein [Sinanaerobacter chloroacetimidivorans]|uniref:TerB N-terminal domain-containing protein n=1 Tax=Sinanaerobacter chloroacetimidivorans TaxID=2818044 RepID=A0A8J7W3P1_9FIRM|nr:TerB N-terminal domain-containing protein [Sinanaerobacter chloroacetimidivorans]MBR0600302.1 TerB N-terminal domain-containing protein [Sinanaerobacter chloroacetimidivorans]